jgi:hypothetical protein
VAVTRPPQTLGETPGAGPGDPRPESPRRLAWRRFRRDRIAVASAAFLAVLLFACFPGAKLYELAVGHEPNDFFPYAVSVSQRPAGPLTVTWDTPRWPRRIPSR